MEAVGGEVAMPCCLGDRRHLLGSLSHAAPPKIPITAASYSQVKMISRTWDCCEDALIRSESPKWGSLWPANTVKGLAAATSATPPSLGLLTQCFTARRNSQSQIIYFNSQSYRPTPPTAPGHQNILLFHSNLKCRSQGVSFPSAGSGSKKLIQVWI